MGRKYLDLSARLAALAFLGLALLASFSSAAVAAEPFNDVAFDAAQRANKTILLDVTASWCPVCRIQGLIIRRAEARMPQFVVFTIDFDKDTDLLKRFDVSYQSTLIVMKGTKELSRSTGDTNEDRIDAMIQQGL